MRRLLLAIATLALGVSSLAAPVASAASFSTTLVKDGFSRPVFVTNAGDSRLFVVEQDGLIKIIHDNNSVATFLDLTGIVKQGGGEQGLLGLAFHPNYNVNGLFYVYYTPSSGGAEVLAEYQRNADGETADPNSARTLLTLSDPYTNHNGGWMAFNGSYLYLSLGDGGSAGDPQNRAQNLGAWWGKILRINPLDPDGSGPKKYSVPSTNPFVGRSGVHPEIWSYGLRNPWRCSFDDSTGQLWCGDVGQDMYEEVDRVKTGRGVNFGWHLLEGMHYYKDGSHPRGALCTSGCKKKPIAEYAHSAFGGGNCAVTGGYVSRRPGAALEGSYIFGDYCSGKVWIIPSNYTAGAALPAPVADTDYNISSFGQGSDGRLYLVDLNGAIYRIDQS